MDNRCGQEQWAKLTSSTSFSGELKTGIYFIVMCCYGVTKTLMKVKKKTQFLLNQANMQIIPFYFRILKKKKKLSGENWSICVTISIKKLVVLLYCYWHEKGSGF